MSGTHLQTYSTRSKGQVFAFAVMFPLGVVLVWGSWTDVVAHGTETRFLGFFVFGVLFLAVSLFVLHGLVRPSVAEGEVDADHIRCSRNGQLKLEIAKADIARVSVTSSLSPSSHWIYTNDGRVVRVWRIFFENHGSFREALTAFGYPVEKPKSLRSLLKRR